MTASFDQLLQGGANWGTNKIMPNWFWWFCHCTIRLWIYCSILHSFCKLHMYIKVLLWGLCANLWFSIPGILDISLFPIWSPNVLWYMWTQTLFLARPCSRNHWLKPSHLLTHTFTLELCDHHCDHVCIDLYLASSCGTLLSCLAGSLWWYRW